METCKQDPRAPHGFMLDESYQQNRYVCECEFWNPDTIELDRLRRALHEICEEWAGAECGTPVHAQEAYAIALAQRMYRIAADALKTPPAQS